ncbi:glycosyl hydrolase family 61-domain-containing protein [Mycena rosella]|uniref:lytic cellulose monooxygenase (C4-dehydrogenating) n=1 Tax=Mycena rosella TaxID=1033263 RepID=A0AAD7AYH8_MYCRO|nr:glycosyl hydrolase family 61-domain-containing protein [Mycena rosella]
MHSLSLAAAILASTSLVQLVVGHGQVNRVTVGSTSNSGPNQYYSGDSKNSKTATRVMYKASSPAYVLPNGFTDNSQMSCEGSSKSPAPETISVAAGQEIEVFWEGATSELKGQPGTGSLTAYNPWVHAMGFVIDYITSCNGDCTTFDATNAGWTKIAHAGMDMSQSISSALRATMKAKPEQYYPTSGNGLWAMAKMVQNGSKWSIKIPSSLKSGQYMVRHELSAVHNPKNSDPTTGPQLYIACIQLDVTNGGDATLPAGTQAKSLYSPDGAFVNINVLSGFNPADIGIPGPAIWDGVSSSSSNNGNTGNKAATTKATTAAAFAPTTTKKAATTTSSGAASTSSRACRKRRGLLTRGKRAHKANAPSRRTHQNRLA